MPTPARPAFPRSRGGYDQPAHPLLPKAKVYVLMVGINDYPKPNQLYGCLKDLDAIQSFLLEHFGIDNQSTKIDESQDPLAQSQSFLIDQLENYHSLHLCTMLNKQATYHNIIRGFRNFLRLAGPNDIVWFHFSGHGSEEFTAEELLGMEPSGKDQTLVCYFEKEADGRLHLADKELGLLLHEVATLNRAGQPKSGTPHMIVSLDCCHSGSGTREEMTIKARNFKLEPERNIQHNSTPRRNLTTYLDQTLTKQLETTGFLSIPTASHILLSACESWQKAGDTSEGGLFTVGLTEILKKTGGMLNYAELLGRTRFKVHQLGKERDNPQNPQFETIGQFDPYVRFLDGSKMGNPMSYEVFFEKGHWIVKCGAIHGLPIKPDQQPEFEIKTLAPENKSLGMAKAYAVGSQLSVLKPEETLEKILEKHQKATFQAIIKKLLAPPIYVLLKGANKGIEQLKAKWDASMNIEPTMNESDIDNIPLKVEVTEKNYNIWDLLNNKLLKSITIDQTAPKVVMRDLSTIVKWDRTLHLNNPKSAIQHHTELLLDVMVSGETTSYNQSYLQLQPGITPIRIKPKVKAVHAEFIPKVKIKNCSQKLYCYLLHFRSNFGIYSYEDQVLYDPKYYTGEDVILPLWKSARVWGLGKKEEQNSSFFKLFVTTEELDHQQLLQEGISDHRFKARASQPFRITNDWCSLTMEVNMRQ